MAQAHIMKCIRLFHINEPEGEKRRERQRCISVSRFPLSVARRVCVFMCDLVRFFVLSSHRVVASRNIKYLAILSE